MIIFGSFSQPFTPGDFIENQNAVAQSANFKIDGIGTFKSGSDTVNINPTEVQVTDGVTGVVLLKDRIVLAAVGGTKQLLLMFNGTSWAFATSQPVIFNSETGSSLAATNPTDFVRLQDLPAGFINPMTTIGDMIGALSGGTPIRIGIGTALPGNLLGINATGDGQKYFSIGRDFSVNITINTGPAVGAYSFSVAQSKAEFTALTASRANLLTVATNGAMYEVAGYLNVTALTGTIGVALSVTYIDLNGNTITQNFFPVSGTLVTNIQAVGTYSFPNICIRTQAPGPNNIVFNTVVTVVSGTLTYDVGVYLRRLSQ